MGRFTQRGVAKLKAPPKPKRLDKISKIDRGLVLALRVSYSGAKTWRILYYINGRPRYQTIGKFPEIGVSQAYKLARKFEPDSAAKKAKVGTFKEVAQDFITSYVRGRGSTIEG